MKDVFSVGGLLEAENHRRRVYICFPDRKENLGGEREQGQRSRGCRAPCPICKRRLQAVDADGHSGLVRDMYCRGALRPPGHTVGGLSVCQVVSPS